MSQKSDLPNDYESAKKYFEWLKGLGVFDKIYLSGSRSPERDKQPLEHSDWDFVGLTSIKNLTMVRPRETKVLHGDLGICDCPEMVPNKAVEIFPEDKYKVFTDGS